MKKNSENIIKVIESISEQIQVLALNIAVAAAKMSYRNELTLDVNNKLSQLVNQATLTVKNMRYVLKVAGSDKSKQDIFADEFNVKIDSEMVSNIENSLQAILEDSQKIIGILNKVKQESLKDFGG